MKIAVAGGTGRVGRHVVDVLKTDGHEVIAMSRASDVDVITAEGLAKALSGVETIIDAASGPSPEQVAATEFFTTAARNLQEHGARAGVREIIVVSIIGIDKFTAGYMAAKIAHEKAMQSGVVPTRILRAAQFHELVAQIMEWGRQGDVCYVPKMRTQLVAARTVAEALAEMVRRGGPAHRPSGTAQAAIQEIAGPKVEELVDAAMRLAAKRGDRVRIEGVSDVADPDRALYQSGALLPGRNAVLAGPTFEEWLTSAENVQSRLSGQAGGR